MRQSDYKFYEHCVKKDDKQLEDIEEPTDDELERDED